MVRGGQPEWRYNRNLPIGFKLVAWARCGVGGACHKKQLKQDLGIICGFLLPALFCFLILFESLFCWLWACSGAFSSTFADSVRISNRGKVIQSWMPESRREGPTRRGGAWSSGRNGCWLCERDSDSENSRAVLSSPHNCHLQPPALLLLPSTPLLRLSAALSGNPRRAEVRWSDKQEVQWNFHSWKKKKKKGPWHEKQNRGFGMLITAPFIRQLY